MRFENPVALTLLLLIPLLLFMRRRRTHVQRPVANLYLWRESAARDTNTLARRIRRDWLLILQAAFMAVVALAAARPVIADTRTSVAFVLDTSLSMGARQGADTRLDLAKARAAELLNRLPAGARVRVVATGGNDPLTGVPFVASDPALLNAIRSARTTDGNGDLSGAIERARQARPAPDRVYVFSDLDAARVTARGAELEWITVGSRADNAAITAFGARPSPGRQDAKQILVTVANYGAATIDADLRLATDAAEIARQRVTVGARSSSSYSFDLASAAGVLVARLDHQDALAADNVRWLALPAGDGIRLFLPAPPGFFLGKALAANPEFTRAASADDADVIVCAGCSVLPAGTAGVLLVNAPSGTAAGVTLTKVATDHPIADGLEIDGTRAVLRNGAAPPLASTVIARGNGEAALLAYETGASETVRRVVDSRVDFEDGPFPLNAAFPVLVANAVRWLANRDVNPLTVNAGEPLRWHVNEQRAPIVAGPDGRTLPSAFNGGVLSTSATGVAGLYRIQLGSTQQAVVVNPVVDGESNLESAPPPAIANIAAPVSDDVRYREIATVLMLAALLLLALEWRHQLRTAA
jgi:hypothetical protein